jgi:vancomycin resistance protein VanW
MPLRRIRRLLPFGLRAEILRLLRWIEIKRLDARFAVSKGVSIDFPLVLARAQSPLLRQHSAISPELQSGKENNVRLAAAAIDNVVLPPGAEFSYHALVGRPSRARGFRPGFELHNGKLSSGIGGGCCQVSNMLYWLALNAGLTITERHRHGFDLFPDCNRKVPFGCGATVFYNYRDLRFLNPWPCPVLVTLAVKDGSLCGAIWSAQKPVFSIEVVERDHRFFVEHGTRFRENRIIRRYVDTTGTTVKEEEIAHNCGEVRYREGD